MSDARPEDEASAEEREQAEALARALEGETHERVPHDALEVAALLRYARDGDRTDALRLARVYQRLRRGRTRTTVLAGLMVAAAALAMAVLPARRPSAPEAAPRTELRVDGLRALLDEQGRVLADPARDLGELERLSAQHRRALLGRLGASSSGGGP